VTGDLLFAPFFTPFFSFPRDLPSFPFAPPPGVVAHLRPGLDLPFRDDPMPRLSFFCEAPLFFRGVLSFFAMVGSSLFQATLSPTLQVGYSTDSNLRPFAWQNTVYAGSLPRPFLWLGFRESRWSAVLQAFFRMVFIAFSPPLQFLHFRSRQLLTNWVIFAVFFFFTECPRALSPPLL